ncbi:hypothetical protein HMPREF6123_1751 [Oribacterium sinus F0268]|uniref:Uncharacterized protein n=1 Tax=Oribacterium sinus F0268 TaxID=585501 RepID=C2KZ32_9FIRM|nr:hypothetical protein HMPREF6123_1751 [Oribacterium sinus F0268]
MPFRLNTYGKHCSTRYRMDGAKVFDGNRSKALRIKAGSSFYF